MRIEISKRRPDGIQAKFAIVGVIQELNTPKEEVAEMLLEAELHGNSSGLVRVHIHESNGFHTLG